MIMAGPSEKEFQAMFDKAWAIPGHFGKLEAKFLYSLARRRGNLVEIGCWQGRTTIIMQMAAQKWGAHLTTVDPFGRERMPPRYRKLPHSPENWRINLMKVGLKPPALLHMTVLHDMFFPGIRGVASAVAEWWDGRSWRMIDLVQATIAFRRVR